MAINIKQSFTKKKCDKKVLIHVRGPNDREFAYEIIIDDYIQNIVHAHNTDVLEMILLYGWESLFDWSDKELSEYINDSIEPVNLSENIRKEILKIDYKF